MGTQHHSNQNNVIKFCDNSSGIKGMELECMYPTNPAQASPYKSQHASRHIIFTAETHNFPTGVAPFSGATTGTGGRIRDVQSAGKGGHVIAGTAGYCFGNLHIPGFVLPWEEDGWEYPSSFAPPLQVAIEASDGASEYGNKFGEPVLAGFARSFGMRLVNGERRKWIKPIMFSGGLGSIEDQHRGDPTLSVLELWGAEYQESNALLLRPSDRSFLERVCQREKCPVDFVDKITGDGKDEKCSGNWMWAAKLPGEGAFLWEACQAMCEVMGQLGVAVDGGKDSLSMVARVSGETVKAPGSLVISVYAVCPDITATVTPDLDNPDGKGVLLYVPGSSGKYRLGGSALAQCYGQLGDCSPDLDQLDKLSACFNTTQILIQVMEALFSEELGLVLEVCERNASSVCQRYTDAGLLCHRIGRTSGFGPDARVIVSVCGQEVLNEHLPTLRAIWESTSFQLERLQANPLCVQEEEEGLASRTQPYIKLTFDPSQTPIIKELSSGKACVAVMREEGSNGDREIAASLFMAGFEVWDVTMQDLCSGSTTLDPFRAVVFVGGFRYADVLGSAKGWAATVTFNPKAREEFDRFRNRDDTLSLGVCNGCQLMALLGWVGEREDGGSDVTLTHNKSGRFESRFVSVGILPSPAVMLKGMEGSALGIWVAHGEGLMQFRSPEAQKKLIDGSLAPLRYLDDSGTPTEIYPMNPNGSAQGVAGICSADGRHLAMMPHPERAVLGWQWAWHSAPQGITGGLTVA
ncbi:hypothetical protein cypCar_00020975 [Cyprinus carpio]|nr:hypothetical protein cypCar_00020975 [Cyprinus carpio]